MRAIRTVSSTRKFVYKTQSSSPAKRCLSYRCTKISKGCSRRFRISTSAMATLASSFSSSVCRPGQRVTRNQRGLVCLRWHSSSYLTTTLSAEHWHHVTARRFSDSDSNMMTTMLLLLLERLSFIVRLRLLRSFARMIIHVTSAMKWSHFKLRSHFCVFARKQLRLQ